MSPVEGWSSARLADVCRITSGATPKTAVKAYWGGSIPWVTPNDLSKDRSQTVFSGERSLSEAGYESCSARLFPEGSVIVSSRAPIGYVAIAGTNMCTNQGCKTATPPHFIDSKYLYWYLVNAKGDLESRASGTTFKEISTKGFGETVLRWPPLEEQQRIVAILDDHLSRLDAATEAARTSLLRLSALRISALTTARNQLVEEGSVMRQLGAVAQTALGKMLDAKRAAGSPTPYLRNFNVRWGSFELDDIQEVPLSTDERERLALQAGDLLVCEGGEPGRCAVWPGSKSLVAYQKALHRVRTHDSESVDVHFLALMLEEFIKAGRADRMFTGTTIKHLPQEKLRLVELPIPTLERQREVLRSLDSLGEGAALLENELGKVQSRAASLRRSLLTAAFSGQLTSSHGFNEEVA